MKNVLIAILVIGFISANIYFAVKTKVITLPASLSSFSSVKGLPSGFPVYDDAKLLGVNTANSKKPSFAWQTPDEVGKVTSWYQSGLKTDGWTITIPPSDTNAYKNTATNLEARKGSRIVQLSVIKDSATTRIVAEFPDPSMFEEQEETK